MPRRNGRTRHDEQTLLKRISINPQICGGRPCIKGHRIPVELVLELVAAGISPREICAKWYPTLHANDVYASVAFATQLVRNEEIHFSEELAASRR